MHAPHPALLPDFEGAQAVEHGRTADTLFSQHWVFNVGSPPPTAVRKKDRPRKRARSSSVKAISVPAPAAVALTPISEPPSTSPSGHFPVAVAPPTPPATPATPVHANDAVSIDLPVELVQSTIELALMQPLSHSDIFRRGRWLGSLQSASLVCSTWRDAVRALCATLVHTADRCTPFCLAPWTARDWQPAYYWLWQLAMHRRRLMESVMRDGLPVRNGPKTKRQGSQNVSQRSDRDAASDPL